MKSTFFPATERGFADHGWLRSYHSFSFADFHNPKLMRFGALRVVNDDWVAGGGGFPTHPHDNMEIVTIVQTGALKHKDTLGNQYTIGAGEVQRMSAGTGIAHSEFNASEKDDVNLFQIWVYPRSRGITPEYEQKRFDLENAQGRWQKLVSPQGEDGSLRIHQDAWFSQALIEKPLNYDLHSAQSGLYLICAEGRVRAGAQELGPRDAIGVSDTGSLTINPLEKSKLIAIEIPMT
jgi:redox-sensitive bicupin YhaK (pirin superfamily)